MSCLTLDLSPSKTFLTSSKFSFPGALIFGQYSKTLPNALEFGLATGTAAGVAGAVTGPGSIFTAKGGFLVGFLGSMAFDSYAIEGGSMYLDLVEEGMDDQTAKHIATGVG